MLFMKDKKPIQYSILLITSSVLLSFGTSNTYIFLDLKYRRIAKNYRKLMPYATS